MNKIPYYINPSEKWKHPTREELLKALREVNEKNEEDHRAMIARINEALSSGLRCGPIKK